MRQELLKRLKNSIIMENFMRLVFCFLLLSLTCSCSFKEFRSNTFAGKSSVGRDAVDAAYLPEGVNR